MSDKSVEQKYKKLTDIEHVLLRPGMWIGSTKLQKDPMYLLDEGRLDLFNVTYNPGFIKIFDEIISNSVDEHRRPSSKLNYIKVEINKEEGYISIWDNGGIPVIKHSEYDEYIPEFIFSSLKAGSNFDDSEDRIVGGTNGVGATVTNIFSTKFTVKTADGKKMFTQTYKNNMHDKGKIIIKDSTHRFTEVKYYPDLEKFGLTSIDDITIDVIRKRMIDIAACNPYLKLKLNDETYRFQDFRKYASMYISSKTFFESNGKWRLVVGHSANGFKQVSFVNSLGTKDGGTHVDYVVNQIIFALRERFKKKYKIDVKPSEIKNHLFIVLDSTVVNSSFNSQTKDKLITPASEFGYDLLISPKIIDGIFQSEIIQSILDWIERKKAAEEKKNLRDLNKEVSKIKVPKLIDAKESKNREKCVLCIFEGDSATSAVRRYRDVSTIGAFPLKGKFLNVREQSTARILSNAEVKNLMASVGLKIGEKCFVYNRAGQFVASKLRYGKIYLYTDADPDGDSISAMLINFFAKYWPELFKEGRIYKVMTPIVVAKSGTTVHKFYTQEEYDKWEHSLTNISRWKIEYKKGLASLENEEYKEIIREPELFQISLDDEYNDTLNGWFSGDSLIRKRKILGSDNVSGSELF